MGAAMIILAGILVLLFGLAVAHGLRAPFGTVLRPISVIVGAGLILPGAFQPSRAAPQTVFDGQGGSGGTDSDVQDFLNLMTVRAARYLSVDPSISAPVGPAPTRDQ